MYEKQYATQVLSDGKIVTGTLSPESKKAREMQVCSAPTILGWKSPDKCPRCRKYVNVRRKCLRCDTVFMPGCGSSHTCKKCYQTRPIES